LSAARRAGIILSAMKLAVLSLLGLFAFVHDCGDDGGDGPAAATGEVWEQVFASWSCTAEGRPPIAFEVQRVSDTGIVHRWRSGGAQGDASVHLDALYLEGFNGIAYDDYGYAEQPKGTLAALDEFNQGAGTAPYHCVKQP
jgi:hypothetical protein